MVVVPCGDLRGLQAGAGAWGRPGTRAHCAVWEQRIALGHAHVRGHLADALDGQGQAHRLERGRSSAAERSALRRSHRSVKSVKRERGWPTPEQREA